MTICFPYFQGPHYVLYLLRLESSNKVYIVKFYKVFEIGSFLRSSIRDNMFWLVITNNVTFFYIKRYSQGDET